MINKFQQNYTQGVFVGMVCNANCSFCNTQKAIGRIESYYKFYDFDTIKIDLETKINNGATCIIYEGGDFSLHPDIFKILEYGQSLGIRQTFQTNGMRLYDMDFVKKIKKYGVNDMNFSIHAYKEDVYDSIMGVKGGLQKALKGLFNCNKLGMSISNNFVLVKENLNQLKGVLVLSARMKVKLLNVTMYIPVNEMSEDFHRKFMVDPTEFGIEYSKMLSLYRKLYFKKDDNILKLKFHNVGRCIFNREYHNIDFQFDLDRRKDNKDYKYNTGFYKKNDCERCIYNLDCPGFTEKYIKVFGDDYIKPILGN